MWKLVIEDDEGKRTAVPLTREQYSIGRRDGNTIRLTERNVSREHARLFRRSEPAAGGKSTFALEDFGSYNGVFVNGLRVTNEQHLAHGDLIQIGDYRIVLQDEAIADAEAPASGDLKQTVPTAPPVRGAALLDRPNRFVMLAGPTMGAEFPLDRERLIIGRAEDATISINHNSVSRLHAEVHALGDGRFEIVDKGSSNGVSVNGAELRRGIIEPGDIIELGDVRLKFVGAGQIFRASESQPLLGVTDRATNGVARRRSSYTWPLAAFVMVVVAGVAGAWVYTRPRAGETSRETSATESPARAALDHAKALSASGDYDAAHEALATIADTSPWRLAPDFRDVVNKWADELLRRADKESDTTMKRALYQRVAQAMTVEASRRKAGADKLQELDLGAGSTAPSATHTPIASVAAPEADAQPPPAPAAAAPAAPAARPDAGRRWVAASNPSSQLAIPPPLPQPPSLPGVTAPKPSTAGVDERERQLALQGTPEAKVLLRQQLEQRVYGGKASDVEIRLLISTCKDLGDKVCVQQARAMLAQRQQP